MELAGFFKREKGLQSLKTEKRRSQKNFVGREVGRELSPDGVFPLSRGNERVRVRMALFCVSFFLAPRIGALFIFERCGTAVRPCA
jgi:hypothetical protein